MQQKGEKETWSSNPNHNYLSVCRSCWYPNSAEGCLVSLCLGLAGLTVGLNFLSSPPSYPHLLKCLSKPFSLLQFSPHFNFCIPPTVQASKCEHLITNSNLYSIFSYFLLIPFCLIYPFASFFTSIST